MKLLSLFRLAGAMAMLAVPAPAQMSSFPSPPPLPAQQSSSYSGSSVAPADPAAVASDSAAPARSSTTGSPTAPTVTAATLTSMNALDDKVGLEAGDTISFRVIEDRDEPVTRIVTDTGEVDFPYIGRVKVEGKTCHAVALEVKKLLEVDYYKQATVIVGLDLIVGDEENKIKPKDMAWVMGEVRDVGPQELLKKQPMTVSQLIMRAGGFSDFADQRKVKLIHKPLDGSAAAPSSPETDAKDFQVVDVRSVFDGKPAADPLVQAGDYIIVPKKFVNFGN